MTVTSAKMANYFCREIGSNTSYYHYLIAGIDLKKAAKLFANKFSCGSSVTGDDEIVIQGDFSYDVIELIQSNWPEVNHGIFSHRNLLVARGILIRGRIFSCFLHCATITMCQKLPVRSDFKYIMVPM